MVADVVVLGVGTKKTNGLFCSNMQRIKGDFFQPMLGGWKMHVEI